MPFSRAIVSRNSLGINKNHNSSCARKSINYHDPCIIQAQSLKGAPKIYPQFSPALFTNLISHFVTQIQCKSLIRPRAASPSLLSRVHKKNPIANLIPQLYSHENHVPRTKLFHVVKRKEKTKKKHFVSRARARACVCKSPRASQRQIRYTGLRAPRESNSRICRFEGAFASCSWAVQRFAEAPCKRINRFVFVFPEWIFSFLGWVASRSRFFDANLRNG